MKFKQLTPDERYMISAYRKAGLSVSQMAVEMNRHRSTIHREIKRHSRQGGIYRPSYAVTRALTRRSTARRGFKIHPDDLFVIKQLLRHKWSPEQISGTLTANACLSISHQTIYNYINWDRHEGGSLWKHLRQASKKRRKRYRSLDSRGVLPNKRHISERSELIDNRERIGDWEIDTVMGSGDKHCIVTMVERKTGYTLIGKLKSRTVDELNWVTRKLIRNHQDKMHTITADNGTEFHGYSDLEDDTDVTFYFATPYHSWERGTNENTNGLIRQYLPKGKSMAILSQKACNKIAFELNNRPRKRYGFLTPATLFWDDDSVAVRF
jgi:IS30 family transposase